jgi:hypothetical protein
MGSSVLAGLPIFVVSRRSASRMGFFSFLFRRPVFIVDPVFGRLRQVDVDKRTGCVGFIAENLAFAPVSQPVCFHLDATEFGPSQAQQHFFQCLEHKYDTLITGLIPIIEEEFRKWKPGFRIQHFKAEFWPTDISIPLLDASTTMIDWDWSFETIHDDNHTFTFYMHGDEPEPGMQMDG